jgi:hypothetical protein
VSAIGRIRGEQHLLSACIVVSEVLRLPRALSGQCEVRVIGMHDWRERRDP